MPGPAILVGWGPPDVLRSFPQGLQRTSGLTSRVLADDRRMSMKGVRIGSEDNRAKALFENLGPQHPADIVEVLNICTEAGVTNVAFATAR